MKLSRYKIKKQRVREIMLKDEAIPLYYKLQTILRNKILSGELVSGDRLPTEKDLAKEYKVSRATVRQALASLEKDGLIIRRRGKGTFVSKDIRIFFDPFKFAGSVDDFTCMGISTSTKVIDFGVTRIPREIAECLQLPVNSRVVRVIRLRFVERYPYCYLLNYLPIEIGQKIQPDILRVKPLVKVLEDDLGIYLAKAVQTFEATIADSEVALLLDTGVGDPLLKIERIVYDANNKPVEFVSSLYRADKYLFKMTLKRKKEGTFSAWDLA